jgi:hypothetical protein
LSQTRVEAFASAGVAELEILLKMIADPPARWREAMSREKLFGERETSLCLLTVQLHLLRNLGVETNRPACKVLSHSWNGSDWFSKVFSKRQMADDAAGRRPALWSAPL